MSDWFAGIVSYIGWERIALWFPIGVVVLWIAIIARIIYGIRKGQK
jgi:hypothetical protein